jgi:hypothetical protein
MVDVKTYGLPLGGHGTLANRTNLYVDMSRVSYLQGSNNVKPIL